METESVIRIKYQLYRRSEVKRKEIIINIKSRKHTFIYQCLIYTVFVLTVIE